MKNLNIVITASIIVSLFSQFAIAKTIKVPENESSIQSAMEKADDSDTIFIKNGTYREKLTLKENISLIGESTQGTIIKGRGHGTVITAANNTLIKNLTITNGATGIKCENTSNTIEACWIKDNKGTGIQTLISVPNIRNSVISRNEWTGIYCESGRSMKTTIEHNIIAENGYSGMMLSGTCEILIQNNIIFGNKQFGIWASEGARKSRIIYNDFSGNRTISNYFATIDRSNQNIDPNFPTTSTGYDFFFHPESMKGKGKDGAAIGLIGETELQQTISDPDGDGVIGEKDQCPSIAEDIDRFEDEDGCPDFDNDKDDIFDAQDQCPNDPEDVDNFKDDDGCPDLDNDNDGIPDSTDLCKNNKETVNGFKDDDGCPDEVPATK